MKVFKSSSAKLSSGFLSHFYLCRVICWEMLKKVSISISCMIKIMDYCTTALLERCGCGLLDWDPSNTFCTCKQTLVQL